MENKYNLGEEIRKAWNAERDARSIQEEIDRTYDEGERIKLLDRLYEKRYVCYEVHEKARLTVLGQMDRAPRNCRETFKGKLEHHEMKIREIKEDLNEILMECGIPDFEEF